MAIGLVAVASCGSRTGLFVDPPVDVPDATADVIGRPDARLDAGEDARLDAAIDAPIDGPVACVPGRFDFTLARPELVFVLDRSGSMAFALDADAPPAPGQPTRWRALRDALAQTLLPLSSEIAMGARFYPAANADATHPVFACTQDPPGVAIAPAVGNANAILRVFDQTTPVGGTPTAVALSLAAQQLSVSRAVARAMVVATDGAPNCNSSLDGQTCACTSTAPEGCTFGPTGGVNCLDDTRTIETLTDIFENQKIPVYVVGIGVTTSFAATLDAMALAGGRPRAGTPRYYPAETPAELEGALAAVRDSVARCSYVTPSAPDDPDAVSVTVGGLPIERDLDRVDGWDWIDREYGHLQLFGAACTAATASNVSGVVACDRDR